MYTNLRANMRFASNWKNGGIAKGCRLHEVINLSLDRFEGLLEDLKGCERLRALKKVLEG